MSIDFKDAHFPKSVIVYAVFFCFRYSVSYRELQEIMAERGVEGSDTFIVAIKFSFRRNPYSQIGKVCQFIINSYRCVARKPIKLIASQRAIACQNGTANKSAPRTNSSK